MRVPIFWLREFCDPGLNASEIADRLNLTGSEVERIDSFGVSNHEMFVVGKVNRVEPHPDADRLRVCFVDLGDGEEQIVCGAPNVAAGQTVAVARPGAVMVDGQALKPAKLRGVESFGMILAEDELGLGSDHSGIMVLADDNAAGTPLADVLPLGSEVLELEITPNRPDCLSVYGIARELHAATGAPLEPDPSSDDLGAAGDIQGFKVAIEASDLCPRFTARLFEDIKVGPSPLWLKAKLMAAGQRPINNIVDITNYVMLPIGQPLHAFDADRIAGGELIVRRARKGEELETLDGVKRKLTSETCVICDSTGPASIAGLMGGQRTEVSGETTRVLLESAVWNGPNIQRESMNLGLRSEASSRFEKGLPAELAAAGQALATKLFVEVAGARLVAGTIDERSSLPESLKLQLRSARVERILGARIELEDASEILQRLGFGVESGGDGVLEVSVPYWRRGDTTREIDLIEEVGRIWGFDKLPTTLPLRRNTGGLTQSQKFGRRVHDALVGAGFAEVVGWSFTARDVADRLALTADDPRRAAVAIRNPLSDEQASLRTMLLPSILDIAARNRARGREDMRIFEMGSRILPNGGASNALPIETNGICVLLTGGHRRATWSEPEPAVADFFAAKSVLEMLCASLSVACTVRPSSEQFLHPGRAGQILLGDEAAAAGWIGELHPEVAQQWQLGMTAVFELDLETLVRLAPTIPTFTPVSSFPAVRQDIAVVVGSNVAAADVLAIVRGNGGENLVDTEIFDVYHGEQLGPDRTSLAIRLTFQAPDRTLTDAEIGPSRDQIVKALERELGAQLRS